MTQRTTEVAAARTVAETLSTISRPTSITKEPVVDPTLNPTLGMGLLTSSMKTDLGASPNRPISHLHRKAPSCRKDSLNNMINIKAPATRAIMSRLPYRVRQPTLTELAPPQIIIKLESRIEASQMIVMS